MVYEFQNSLFNKKNQNSSDTEASPITSKQMTPEAINSGFDIFTSPVMHFKCLLDCSIRSFCQHKLKIQN